VSSAYIELRRRLLRVVFFAAFFREDLRVDLRPPFLALFFLPPFFLAAMVFSVEGVNELPIPRWIGACGGASARQSRRRRAPTL
jgi:hypothetical protein